MGSGAPVQLTSTGTEKLKLTVNVPEEIANAPAGKPRTFMVWRIHNGVVTKVGDGTEKIIPVETDLFSTYFITYQDTDVPATGDANHILIWVLLMAAAAAVLLVMKKQRA